jgi:hypothetical protein
MSECPIDPTPLQPPLRTEEFQTLFHLLKIATVCKDLSILLIYFIDTVEITALVHLAEQFDVLGYKGWLLADTEQKQRDLVQDSVRLHRIAGTPESILEILEKLGYPGLGIIENPCMLYDGTWKYDGTEKYVGRLFDRFMVDNVTTLPDAERPLVTELVNTWKNVRSNFFQPFEPRFYDGSWTYNGDVVYNGKSDNEITDYEPYKQCTNVPEI